MRAEDRRQPGIVKALLECSTHFIGRQVPVGQRLPVSQGQAEQRELLRIPIGPVPLDVVREPVVEVVSNGDVALLPSPSPKFQKPLDPLILQAPLAANRRWRRSRPGCRPGCPKEPDRAGLQHERHRPSGANLRSAGWKGRGRSPSGGVVLPAVDRLEGIQGRDVPGQQGVEEVPQGGQGLFLAPGEEAPHHAGKGAAAGEIRASKNSSVANSTWTPARSRTAGTDRAGSRSWEVGSRTVSARDRSMAIQ